jgi:D-alanine-D-alanine ligase
MYEMAAKAFAACHCKGISRIDFRFDELNVYFLELNTQPGMTKVSLVPDIAKFYNVADEAILVNGMSKLSNDKQI